MEKSNGFTLIEIIITLAITMVLIVAAIPTYHTYNQQLQLKDETKNIFSVLELARKKAISSDFSNPAVTPDPFTGFTCSNFTGYQVSFTANTYTMSLGCAGGYQPIQTYTISSLNVAIATATPFTITFPPLGLNTKIATPTIRIKNASISTCQDINISSNGVIEVNETLISC